MTSPTIDTGEMRIKQQGAVTQVWLSMSSGDVLRLMLRSDAHHDSMWCKRDIELKHLEESRNRQALIIDAGDLFDCMQGRYDKRRNYDTLRLEYKVPEYYDAVINDAVKFYEPFANNFLLIGKGNHEAGVLKNANVDITSRLTGLLNANGAHILTGGYGGWIIFNFRHKSGGRGVSFRLRYFHGAGAEAPVTRGVIQTNRQAVYLPDADLVHNGHNHNEYTLSIKRERISDRGIQYFDLVHFVRTPGYLDAYADGTDGWEVERGSVPKPIGCVWVDLIYDASSRRAEIKCALTADVV